MTMENAPSTWRERVGDAIDQRAGFGVGDELDDDFGVGGGLEVGAIALEAGAEVAEVDEVAVVGDGDEALGGVDADGLGVEQGRVAGSGVAGVADGHGPGSLASTSSVKISETRPMPLMLARRWPSAEAMPADSWPRCCRRRGRDRPGGRRRDGRGWRLRRILRGAWGRLNQRWTVVSGTVVSDQ
jgi:hypothetical protein